MTFSSLLLLIQTHIIDLMTKAMAGTTAKPRGSTYTKCCWKRVEKLVKGKGYSFLHTCFHWIQPEKKAAFELDAALL